MSGCSVVGCFNTSTKGFKMKRFPRDPQRRKIWAEQVNRKNWSPNNDSRICQDHFTPDMYEQRRADGLIKLKWNAIPTIFPISVDNIYSPVLLSSGNSTNETLTKKIKIESNEDLSVSEDNINIVFSLGSVESTNETLTKKIKMESNEDLSVSEDNINPVFPLGSVESTNETLTKKIKMESNEDLSVSEDNINTVFPLGSVESTNETLTKKIKMESNEDLSVSEENINTVFPLGSVESINETLTHELEYSNKRCNELLKENILLKEQLKKVQWLLNKSEKKNNNNANMSLRKNNSTKFWDVETVKNALNLRFSCGNNGYNELLKQNYPLPSLRTLRRKIIEIKFKPGERPFHCLYKDCNQSFTTSNIRKVHMRTHTGEKPHVCTQEGCNRGFASWTHLKNHMRIHSGEKPFVCPVPNCLKRFTVYSSLYKHQSVHSSAKRHSCPICNKSYRYASTLTTHKRTKHGVIAADDGTEIIREQIGIGEDRTKNITSKLLNLKRGHDSIDDSGSSLYYVSELNEENEDSLDEEILQE